MGMGKKTMNHDELKKLEQLYQEILLSVGEDPQREGLVRTPHRAAKAINFLTKGYGENLDTVINDAVYESDNDEMIIVKDIELYSMCEHHLLPFFGKCHVGYLPNKKIIGLSKIPRLVDVFARRLQIQENLTKEIAEAVMKYTGAIGVGVVIEAQHLCTMMRGVEKQNSKMITSCMLGLFRSESSTRAEFLSLINR
ncbi:MAG: GTP cyclohydrolase I FolE [Candidatus Omnitrophica bacterium]|nr:GTP cyclohydrolase I FolE [Candidatus Omnitrophota bacterium]